MMQTRSERTTHRPGSAHWGTAPRRVAETGKSASHSVRQAHDVRAVVSRRVAHSQPDWEQIGL